MVKRRVACSSEVDPIGQSVRRQSNVHLEKIMREVSSAEIAVVAGGSAVQDPNNPWWQLDKAEPKGPTTEGIVGAGLMSAVCAGTGGVGAVLCGVATYIGVEAVSA